MIGEILQAVIDECKELLKDSVGTIIFKTDFAAKDITSYSMPLLMLEVVDAPDSGQQIGGLSRLDLMFALNTYNYLPNSLVSDDSGYSLSLLKPVDDIRRHFTKGRYLTQGMKDILSNYCFKFTLSGITQADALEQDGVVLGYRLMFDSLAFDIETNQTETSTGKVEHVVDDSRA